MMENPAAPEANSGDDEANLALLVTYFRELQKAKFYGIVELTLQDGELKVSRETRSRPVAALAASIWAQIPGKAKKNLKERLKDHKGFVVD